MTTTAESAAAQAILDREIRALERWSQADPIGYIESFADDATYFDDIGGNARLDGIEAIRAYVGSGFAQLQPHRYEIDDPKVKVHGDVGILTLTYRPSDFEGNALTPWNATLIYRRTGEQWRVVHAHWSLLKRP